MAGDPGSINTQFQIIFQRLIIFSVVQIEPRHVRCLDPLHRNLSPFLIGAQSRICAHQTCSYFILSSVEIRMDLWTTKRASLVAPNMYIELHCLFEFHQKRSVCPLIVRTTPCVSV